MTMTPVQMAEIHARCFTTPRPWHASEFSTLLESPHVFSCVMQGGFLLGRVISGEAELLTLAVSPDSRRRGIGRRLLACFETRARQRGAELAFLEVSEANRAAIALYRASGYAESGRRPGYYREKGGTGADAILMQKPLA